MGIVNQDELGAGLCGAVDLIRAGTEERANPGIGLIEEKVDRNRRTAALLDNWPILKVTINHFHCVDADSECFITDGKHRADKPWDRGFQAC